jgi:hypothetical protein
MPSEQSVTLHCHPSTPTDVVRSIAVRVRRSPDGVLALRFRLDGDLARVRVPVPRPPGIAHRLWEHTCFEAFIAVNGEPAYHELNFAPSGEWAGYLFHSYREVAGLADDALAPEIAVRSSPGQLALDAHVRLAHLSADHPGAALRLGLAAVVEASDGTHSYWSLRHPAADPDFHHADALALRLEPPA